MDFSQLISEAFNITRRNRALWIFGAISAIFGAGPPFINFIFSFPTNFGTSSNMNDFQNSMSTNFDFLKYIDSSVWATIVIAGLIALLAISFFFLYVQIWSFVALVAQTLGLTEGKSVSFRQAWQIGEKYFWRVVGVWSILSLIVLPPIILFIALPVMFFVAGLNVFALIIGAIEVLIFIVALMLYLIVASIMVEFSVRKIVDSDTGVLESIKESWWLFRGSSGKSFLVWLVNVALGFFLGFAFLLASAVFFFIGVAAVAISVWLVVLPIVGFVLTIIFISMLWSVFSTSYWTLAYRQLSKGTE